MARVNDAKVFREFFKPKTENGVIQLLKTPPSDVDNRNTWTLYVGKYGKMYVSPGVNEELNNVQGYVVCETAWTENKRKREYLFF